MTWFPATGKPTIAANPTAGSTISASTPIELTFSKPVKKILGSEKPKLSPEVDGKWSQPNPHTLRFVPSGFGAPLATDLKVELPEEVEVVQSDGSAEERLRGQVGSPGRLELRLQQMLAELDYLPYKFDRRRSREDAGSPGRGGHDGSAEGPLHAALGQHASGLKELWTPGKTNVLIEGALMSFEERKGLEVDGLAGPVVWEELMKASSPAT